MSGPAEDRLPTDSVSAGRSRRQRLESWAWLLPLFGAVLFASPLVRAFAIDVRALGAPLIMIYIFGVWIALIAAAVALARIDRRDDDQPAAPPLKPSPNDRGPLA